MTFTIPNNADAENASQAQVDARDFHDMVALAPGLTGVLSGCAVTAQGSPDMTLAVASGTVVVNGKPANVSAGNVTITTADSSHDRFDLVVVDDTGAKSVVAGTAATTPVFPDPSGKAVLAAIRVPQSATSITSGKITDKRCPVSLVAGALKGQSASHSIGETPQGSTSQGTVAISGVDTDFLFPIMVQRPYTVTGLTLQVSTAGAASTQGRMALYNMDHSTGLPTSLIVDAGTVAVDSTGAKTASFSAITLQPGVYMMAVNFSGTPTVRTHFTFGRWYSFTWSAGGSSFITGLNASRAFAAFPDPYVDAVGTATSGAPNWAYYTALVLSTAY